MGNKIDNETLKSKVYLSKENAGKAFNVLKQETKLGILQLLSKVQISEKFWKFYEERELAIKILGLIILIIWYGYDASLWLDGYANYLKSK